MLLLIEFIFVFGESRQLEQEQPDITASDVYNTHAMVLGSNVRNLVILIPNEAHESISQPKKERPLINQPYLPQNAIINTRTTVVWFNADKAHDHTISLNESNPKITFRSEPIHFSTASLHPVMFINTGTLKYFEKNVSKSDPRFTMSGTISVINQSLTLSPSLNNGSVAYPELKTKNSEIDTVGSFMAPSKDLLKYVKELKGKGFRIDSTFTYSDPRGGQKGTGPDQTLIIWTTSGIKLETITALLGRVISLLPYN